MIQPQIVLLKEGTDTSQGKGQLISNINACAAVVEILKTTLGPRGMDKLIHVNNKVTISNDGATIIQLLDIVHPAAKTLADISKSQDDEVGDGTTTVVLLAGAFLNAAKSFIEDGVNPQVIIRGYRKACQVALKNLRELAVPLEQKQDMDSNRRVMLERCAQTALNSKLIENQKEFFGKMVVDAVLHLDRDELDIDLIGIKNVAGGSVTDSFLVEGVSFKKTFSYAGFEQQPKKFLNPIIVLLNVELELKSERSNAEIRISDPSKYQAIVDAEWKIIYDKLNLIVDSGAQIILSKLPIGDLATQFFADRDLFCAGRVPEVDLERVAAATGGQIQTSLRDLNEEVCGKCSLFEEIQIGKERYNMFSGCPEAKTVTLILRGGAEQFIAETERSVHDSIMIVKRCLQHNAIVAGGGAIEMELSRILKEYARDVTDKTALIISAYAQAFETIPRQLAQNAGFDSTDILNELRAKHAKGGKWYGVDIENEGTCDTFQKFVWEPAVVKSNSIAAATEAACIILSVDETIRNPKSEGLPDQGTPPMAR
uniref:T-complex protein 1 subunit eta n=1 Tax=Hirondellea gigas TaxID=1518452 RepID=A0A6A7G3D5_9CRUS